MKNGELLEEFFAKITDKLEEGDAKFGDAAFHSNNRALLSEIEEELIDVIGWAYPLYWRVQQLKKRASAPKLGSGLDHRDHPLVQAALEVLASGASSSSRVTAMERLRKEVDKVYHP